MPIVWRHAMEVGHPQIDAEHKYLIGIINDFEVAVSISIDYQKVSKILDALADYARLHFSREEKLQVLTRYPYADAHKVAHEKLMRQLADIRGRYDAAPEGPERDALLPGISSFLKDWLVNHIIETDMKMKPYLAGRFTAN